MKQVVVILLCISIFLLAHDARADDGSDDGKSSFLSSLSKNQYMTGNWGGLRDRLVEWGLTPTAIYSASILGNPVGGRRKAVKYAGLLDVYLDFDLERLMGLKQTKIVVSGAWAFGESLSIGDIGNFFTVSNDYNGKSVSLYQFYVETSFWQNRITLALGRMGIGDDFATAGVFCIYVNADIDMNPISLQYNIPAFLSNPDAALGARVRVSPSEDTYIAAGAYNADPDAGQNARLSIHTHK